MLGSSLRSFRDRLRLGGYGSSSLEVEIAFKIGFEFQLGFGLIFSQGG